MRLTSVQFHGCAQTLNEARAGRVDLFYEIAGVIGQSIRTPLRSAVADPVLRAQLAPLEALPLDGPPMTRAGHRAFLKQQINLLDHGDQIRWPRAAVV